MRDFRFFAVQDDDQHPRLHIDAIHDERGYRELRQQLSDQYNLGSREPNIQVWNVDFSGDRSLTLRLFAYQRRPLHESYEAVLDHLATLWGFTVRLEQQEDDGSITLIDEKQSEKRRRS